MLDKDVVINDVRSYMWPALSQYMTSVVNGTPIGGEEGNTVDLLSDNYEDKARGGWKHKITIKGSGETTVTLSLHIQ